MGDTRERGAAALAQPTRPADLTDVHAVDLALDRLAGEDLHRALAALRATGLVADVRFFGQPAAVATTFELVRDILRDDDGIPGAPTYQLSTAPLIGHTFIDAHGAEHTELRKLATPAFRSRAIERFDANRLTTLAHEVLDRVAERGAGDLVADVATVVPYLAIARKLGLPPSREDDTRRWALGLISHAMAPELAAQARAEFDAHVGEVVAARRAAPTDDVLSGLVTAERDGRRFDDDEILAHVRLLFAVGATTTAHGVGNLLSALLHRPALLARVTADRGLRPAAVREALRFDPPVSILPRILTRPTTVAGRDLPASSFLLLGIAGANRDPAVFAAPDDFDLARPSGDVLTFGNGAKFCPGSHLANRELEVVLDAVLDRLPGLELADPAGSLPVGGPLRSPEHLHVTWRA
jgi:cytochrome P450